MLLGRPAADIQNLRKFDDPTIILLMSNRQIVIELVTRLPEDTPLDEIARQIDLLSGIESARQQARNREGIPAEEARKLVDAWVAQ